MRKLGLLLSCFIVLSAFTCDNEPLEGDFEDGTLITNPTQSILGEWTLVNFEVAISSATELEGTTVETNLAIDSFDPDYDLVFTANTFTTNGSYSYNTSITIGDQAPINDSYTIEDVNGSGTYTTSGNEMTIQGSFFDFTFEGIDDSFLDTEDQTATFTLSADGNTLTFSQNETEVNNQGGTSVSTTTVSTSIWSRVSSANNSCDDATAATNAAETAYNNDSSNTSLCNAYVEALEAQIAACGDADGSLQNTINGLNCQSSTGSIIGTWRIVALTSNGVDELQDELNGSNICYWHEVFTATTASDIEYSGDNCTDEFISVDNVPYDLTNNILVVDGDVDDSVEIIELTNTTMRYRQVYTDADNVEIEDIYTFEKQ
jgi:hypothetical protein